MKQRSKLFKFIFMVFMVLLTTILPMQVNAKSVTKISNKSVTLTVGKTKTISLKNYKKLSKKAIKKVKWTASNKKVVSIKVSGKYKQKCKLTAKKAGTSTIKVKYNGKTYKCKVTVKKKATNTTSNNNNNSNDTTSNTDKTPTTPVQPTTPTTPNTPEVPTTPTAPTTPVDNNTNDIVEHDCNVYYDYANPIERDNKIYYVCTICGKEYCEGEVEEFLSYTYEWRVTKEPTCTTKGTKVQYKVYENGTEELTDNTCEIDALGHNFVKTYPDYKCPHEMVSVTTTCTRCDYYNYEEFPYQSNSIDYNTFNNYHIEITLNDDNFTDEYQNAHGGYGACKYEKVCNVCGEIQYTSSTNRFGDICSTISSWKNEGYKVILVADNTTENVTRSDWKEGTLQTIEKIYESVDEDLTK